MRIVFPGGRSKALTLSYDDGTSHDLRLLDIFNAYGLKGAFHLNSGRMKKGDNHVDLTRIAEIYAGQEISCHSYDHPFLDRQPRTEVARQTWMDREILEKHAGYPVTGMSYPMGAFNADIAAILKGCGIEYCRTTAATGRFNTPEDFLQWHPTCHHRDAMKYVQSFLDVKYVGAIFYVWGHSYEFDRDDNWQDIEEFARMTGGHSDVWYATNIEVCRYMKAVHGLVTSTDGRMVYNPAAVTVWVQNSGGVCFPVGPGETIFI